MIVGAEGDRPTAGVPDTNDPRFDEVDAELEKLWAAIKRINEHIGITDVTPEGIPSAGERVGGVGPGKTPN